jgi:hypothetical protein
MSTVPSNPRVAASMSELEIRARKGDPFAQDELERQAYIAASVTKRIQKEGLTRIEAQREAQVKR